MHRLARWLCFQSRAKKSGPRLNGDGGRAPALPTPRPSPHPLHAAPSAAAVGPHRSFFLLARGNASTIMIAFMHAVTAGSPVYLCEDLRRHIVDVSEQRHCRRCRCVVSKGKGRDRVHMCFTRDGLLCFTCWHKLRWPPREA